MTSLETNPEPNYEHTDEYVVLQAVLKLPANYKEAIHMYYYEGCDAAQIAKMLRCSVNTVYSALSRGQQMLKERLGDDFED